MFYGASVVGVAPDKKSVSPPAKSEPWSALNSELPQIEL